MKPGDCTAYTYCQGKLSIEHFLFMFVYNYIEKKQCQAYVQMRCTKHCNIKEIKAIEKSKSEWELITSSSYY